MYAACVPSTSLKSTDAHLFSPLQLLLATGNEWGSERGVGGVLETGAMKEEDNCGGLTIRHRVGAGCTAENRTVRGGVTRLLRPKWSVSKGFLATAVVATWSLTSLPSTRQKGLQRDRDRRNGLQVFKYLIPVSYFSVRAKTWLAYAPCHFLQLSLTVAVAWPIDIFSAGYV